MTVKVRLHSYFAFLSGSKNGIEDIEVEEGTRVKDIIDYYKVKSEYIAVASINKGIVSEDTVVKESDYVEIFPVFGGG